MDGDVHSCATTQSQQDPWWKVDLGASRVVAKVIVAYKNQMEDFKSGLVDSGNRERKLSYLRIILVRTRSIKALHR